MIRKSISIFGFVICQSVFLLVLLYRGVETHVVSCRPPLPSEPAKPFINLKVMQLNSHSCVSPNSRVDVLDQMQTGNFMKRLLNKK